MYDFLTANIDVPVIRLLSHVVHHSEVLDVLMENVEDLYLFKMFPFILFILVAFYCTNNDKKLNLLVTALVGAFLTIVLSRVFQDFLPERARPLYAGLPDFVLPFGVDDDVLNDWSSFPSDTSALASCLAMSIWFYSRRAGALMFLWAAAFVCLPRIYLGYHYTSDVLAGIALGIAIATITRYGLTPWSEKVYSYVHNRAPMVANVLTFVVMFQISTMFDDVRLLMTTVADVILPRIT